MTGVVLFLGTGFVELAIRAGYEVGCPVVEELMLHAPLVLDPGGVAIQVVVGAASSLSSHVVSNLFNAPGDVVSPRGVVRRCSRLSQY